MVASQECRDDRAASGREDRRTDPGNEGEREDQSERRIEDEQDRNRADDDRAHEVTPEHCAAWTHRISNGTAEESEERIGNARDANRESCQQRRLCCTVRYEGERDERDRVTEAADDLGEPEEREVRRSHAVCSWVRFFLQPHERDEEAAERDQQIPNAVDGAAETKRDDVREKRQPRVLTKDDVQRVGRCRRTDSCRGTWVIRHA